MAERPGGAAPILEIEDLHVYYGHSHALQGVTLKLERGVLAVVGRNGMGKTTLCNAVMGLVRAAAGRIRVAGEDITGLASNEIVERGLGYVPQGRRVWPSLTVDEHLRVGARGRKGDWTVERVYETFPRLKERRRNGGAQLSGGEQQMLAIGRALLGNPRLLIMDEPTEGLAPVIVDAVAGMLHELAREGSLGVLLVEQYGVAADVSDNVSVMLNGRIARTMPSAELAADAGLQQRLLGVRSGEEVAPAAALEAEAPAEEMRVYTIRREHAEGDTGPAPARDEGFTAQAIPTRWGSSSAPERPVTSPLILSPSKDEAATSAPQPSSFDGLRVRAEDELREPTVEPISIARTAGRVAYVAGTFDTKGRELGFLKSCIERLGLRTTTVDLSTSRKPSPADVGPQEVARHHPNGAGAVFTGDRGSAVAAMADAFERFIQTRRDVGGLISAGGSGATALATPAMRALPVGVPKVMVSTVASGDVKRYVGPADICMMYAVTDVQGVNRISSRVLSNAAHALAGMLAWRRPDPPDAKPAIGLTMFGLTTPCLQRVAQALEGEYDCLVFHATGTGGQSMEKLADSGLLAGIIDATTTEVPDLLVGGVFAATEDRFGAVIRSGIPYVGSCGALDMVNFGPMDTVPERFRGRTLHRHNPSVTLMRTSAEECAAIGRWIGERLSRMPGPVRFLIPDGGVSGLDAPGQPFWDPAADRALFAALEQSFRAAPNRRLVRLPHHLNDPAFADALVQHFREIVRLARPGAQPARLRPTGASRAALSTPRAS